MRRGERNQFRKNQIDPALQRINPLVSDKLRMPTGRTGSICSFETRSKNLLLESDRSCLLADRSARCFQLPFYYKNAISFVEGINRKRWILRRGTPFLLLFLFPFARLSSLSLTWLIPIYYPQPPWFW